MKGYAQIPNKCMIFFNWILFINSSIFEGLELLETCSNKELSYCFTQMFHHQFKISIITELNEPGVKNLQDHKVLLQKLELKGVQLRKQAFNISLLIMKVWYQDYQPDIWIKISNSNHHSSPERNLMQIVLSKALSEGIMADQNSDEFYWS
jgi:hypothetical protein